MAKLEGCPTCGNQTSENADRCPACGEPLVAGWADTVREQRERKVEESKAQAAIAQRKAKRKKRLIWVSIFAVLIISVIGNGFDDDSVVKNLKEVDPAAYQKRIKELETQVAKVPASNHDESLRLYVALQKLDPENNRYAKKIEHYRQKKAATAKAAREAAQAATVKRAAAEAAAKAAAEGGRRRKGFHCLSSWDGSHSAIKKYTEKRMRDPDSFEHIETRITPVNAKGRHTLIMKYRARNGFGGMTVGVVTATVRNADCSATIASIK